MTTAALGTNPGLLPTIVAARAAGIGRFVYASTIWVYGDAEGPGALDEDTPLELITELKPDVLVKGGDYDMERLAETAVVKAYGGRALAIPFVDGYSTTALVKKIRASA